MTKGVADFKRNPHQKIGHTFYHQPCQFTKTQIRKCDEREILEAGFQEDSTINIACDKSPVCLQPLIIILN